MARVFGIWHGGASYSFGAFPADLETWTSLAHAKHSLVERFRHGYWDTDASTHAVTVDGAGLATVGASSQALRPAVNVETHIDLYPALWQGRGWVLGSEPYARLSLTARETVAVDMF